MSKISKGMFKDTSTIIALVGLFLIFAFSAAPGINRYTTNGYYICLYYCTNFAFNGASGGLLSAYIFVSLATLFTILNLVLSRVYERDRKGNKLETIVGDSSIGYLEVFNSIFLFCAGMLFSFTLQFTKWNISGNGGSIVNDLNTAFIGWGAIVVAILCFALCIYLMYEGVLKLIKRHKIKVEEEEAFYK